MDISRNRNFSEPKQPVTSLNNIKQAGLKGFGSVEFTRARVAYTDLRCYSTDPAAI